MCICKILTTGLCKNNVIIRITYDTLCDVAKISLTSNSSNINIGLYIFGNSITISKSFNYVMLVFDLYSMTFHQLAEGAGTKGAGV